MTAIVSLTILGLVLGLLLGFAARRLHVEAPPLVEELEALLPGTQCGQCGFPGCHGAAEALAAGKAAVTLCPPGGKDLAARLAERLGVTVDLSGLDDDTVRLVRVREDDCIGCTKCFKVCPTDAIIGAPKQIHVVLAEACTACGNCLAVCPTECMDLEPVEVTLGTWHWPRPDIAKAA